MASDNVPHLQATFSTKQPQYSIADVPFSLPSSLSSKELNKLVLELINKESVDDRDVDVAVQFDFLINGEFLRTSLETHLEDRNISSETVLEIEYVERQAAPRPEASLAHDDWVSCVRGKGTLILCGCYDNTLKLWTKESGQCLTTIPGHTGPVKCVAWLSAQDDHQLFASGSHDQNMFVWRWKPAGKEVDCVLSCRGHAGSVDCLDVNADAQRVVTGSWDKMIKVWSCAERDQAASAEDPEEAREAKKLKTSRPRVETRTPLLTVSGHKEAVSSTVWMDESRVCSASWDHTLRLWDMTQGQEISVVEGPKAFFAISSSPLTSLLLSASADRHVRLHDIRTKELKETYTSHTGWVSSVDWSKTREHLFVSGSHDMLMKLWDTRSPKAPLYNLAGQEDKILAVDWSFPDLMLSGGADNQLKMFKYNQGLS